MTDKQFTREVAHCLHNPPRYSILSLWMMRMVGLVNPLARE